MNEKLVISKFCKIINNKIFVNGEIVFKSESSLTFSEFIKEAYKSKEMVYPKFFKMDNLSKLGIIATEFLADELKSENVSGEEIGIIIMNSASSLDTDKNFQNTIIDKTNYFPSPAVFVYTLPNIVIGEICIKHKIFGETAFFISQEFDSDFIYSMISDLLINQGIKIVLTGWVEFLDNEYNASVCVVKNIDNSAENINGIINFTVENFKKTILD
ncbi:MAG: 3-oxoacyl-ACP synthase [Bacteroidia bacterium]|nr:3-oxoacyl-ACP synthase [Bacteroidia bacterium]